MNNYFKGTIIEMLERAKKLKAKLPGANQNVHFNQLSISTQKDIDQVIGDLETLLDDHLHHRDHFSLGEKFVRLKEYIYLLDGIENWPVAALNRQNADDAFLNQLLNKICKELDFPLIPPVASCLSQSYYYIIPQNNLMCVPLLEADFILHIPDVYHELAHLIIDSINNPKVDPYRFKLGGFISYVIGDFNNRIVQEQRKSNPLINAVDMLFNWRDCWAKNWAIELFCDLFGIYSVGPAFAWSHMHLCLKRGGDPFDLPIYHLTDHPPDNARMDTMLIVLDLLGFADESKQIKKKWEEYLMLCGYTAQPEYYKALPTQILELCATMSIEAAKEINVTPANGDSTNEMYLLLNTAWYKFLNDPENYISWEQDEIAKLKENQ